MNISLESKRLDFVFLICLILLLIIPQIYNQSPLNFFAPFIVISFYKKSLQTSLWLAFFCGVIMDLLSDQMHFGMYALNFSLSTMLIYPQKRNFFADSISTLPIMTFFFSFLSTLIMGIQVYSIEMRNPFSWNWIAIDLLLKPGFDGGYAFICFICPALIFGKPQRRGKDYFS